MANKPSDLLNALPSVSELLEKPPIRALADKFNRSVVAGGVRSFLDELRSDLQRRAAEAHIPSVRELAERAARHIIALELQSNRPAINATGCFFGPPWGSLPLAEAALERSFAAGRDFVYCPPSTSTAADAASLLCRLTQAQAATAVHSYAGAIWLALSVLADNQEVIVSRGETGDIDPGRTLPQIAASTSVALTEIGATNRTLVADYEAAVSERTAALLTLSPDGYRIVGETKSPDLDELVGLARDRELALIDARGAAPLVDLPASYGVRRRSIHSSISAGVDLVIARGDGLVGGPQCGLIVGTREIVARITEHPLFPAWQLDAPRTAALAATLDAYVSSPAEPGVPVLQLLATPLENLRDRAERLAPQLSQAPGIASAAAIPTHSVLSLGDGSECGPASYGIALVPADSDVLALERRLASAPRPVIARVERDRLIIDLRTVFPRQDQFLLDAFAAANTANATEPAPAAAVGP